MAETLTINLGGYGHTFTLRHAGPWGCDPCWDCQTRSRDGEVIWMDRYGDLFCDECARDRAFTAEREPAPRYPEASA